MLGSPPSMCVHSMKCIQLFAAATSHVYLHRSCALGTHNERSVKQIHLWAQKCNIYQISKRCILAGSILCSHNTRPLIPRPLIYATRAWRRARSRHPALALRLLGSIFSSRPPACRWSDLSTRSGEHEVAPLRRPGWNFRHLGYRVRSSKPPCAPFLACRDGPGCAGRAFASATWRNGGVSVPLLDLSPFRTPDHWAHHPVGRGA